MNGPQERPIVVLIPEGNSLELDSARAAYPEFFLIAGGYGDSLERMRAMDWAISRNQSAIVVVDDRLRTVFAERAGRMGARCDAFPAW